MDCLPVNCIIEQNPNAVKLIEFYSYWQREEKMETYKSFSIKRPPFSNGTFI